MSLRTPVDVSLNVANTAATSGCWASAFSNCSGRTASPYGTSTGMTVMPTALQMPRYRSPHRPEMSRIAFSPGACEPNAGGRVRRGMGDPLRPSRRHLLAACTDPGPEDGTDPKDWTRHWNFRGPGRKALQLCAQVAEALNTAFAGCGDAVL